MGGFFHHFLASQGLGCSTDQGRAICGQHGLEGVGGPDVGMVGPREGQTGQR